MNRLDLVEKINFKNPLLFKDEYPGLVTPDQLPKPTLERLYENEIWSHPEWREVLNEMA